MRYLRHPALRPKGPAIKRLFKFIPDKFVEMTGKKFVGIGMPTPTKIKLPVCPEPLPPTPAIKLPSIPMKYRHQ